MVEMAGHATADELMASAPYDRAVRYPFFGQDDSGRAVLILPGDEAYPGDTPAIRGPKRVVLEDGRWWVAS